MAQAADIAVAAGGAGGGCAETDAIEPQGVAAGGQPGEVEAGRQACRIGAGHHRAGAVEQIHRQIKVGAVLHPGGAGGGIAHRGVGAAHLPAPDPIAIDEGAIEVGIEAEVDGPRAEEIETEPVGVCARFDAAELAHAAAIEE